MFSVTAFYWGNKQNLESYYNHAKQYTDDVVVGYINLFEEVPEVDGLKLVVFDHKYLLDEGHSALMNIVDDNCKYDWTFHLAVGKRISWVNTDLLTLNAPNICGYMSKEKGNEAGLWSNFHNKKKARWIKTVHEAVQPLDGYQNSMIPIIEWERTSTESHEKQYFWQNENEKKICGAYRQLSRIKWVALEDMNPHPARHVAIEMYEKHKAAYLLGREELIEYLLNNDLSAGM